MESIVDVFYKKIIPEALKGNVDCEIPIRIIFNVYFKETSSFIKATDEYEGVLIPTLMINNKNEFDTLLQKYVETMLSFYQGSSFTNIDPMYYSSFFIATAIANMGTNDYLNPENYFHHKIKAIQDNQLYLSNAPVLIGYSSIFDSNMYYILDKEKPNEEAPIKYTVYLQKGEDLFEFQTIRFLIIDNVAYIGAIQGAPQVQRTPYQKKINRILYKANEAITPEQEIYHTNPGSVVALTSLIALLNNQGIEQVAISPYGIQRWNDKKILYHHLNEKLINNEINDLIRIKVKSVIERATSYFDKAQVIRSQLTNTLLRFPYHFPGNEIIQTDQAPAIICNQSYNCNNTLLNEVYGLVRGLGHKKTNL